MLLSIAEAFVKHRSSVQARLAAPQYLRFRIDPEARRSAGGARQAPQKQTRCTGSVHGSLLAALRTGGPARDGSSPEAGVP
jgi:hypothetical protein